MKAIVRLLAGGKTHRLITDYFLETENILIVMSEREKQRIIEAYKIPEGQTHRIISMHQLKEKLPGISSFTSTKLLLVDNVEYLLSTLLEKIPDVVTFTGENL